MPDTEKVARFKMFAKGHLLALLSAAPDFTLDKSEAYQAIRTAFTQAEGWAPELDEVGPNGRISPWLNRIHWGVSELVQEGVVERSSGSDQLRAIGLRRNLSAPASAGVKLDSERLRGAVRLFRM